MRVEGIAADVKILSEPCSPRRFLAKHAAQPFAARSGGVIVTDAQALAVVGEDHERVRAAERFCARQQWVEQADRQGRQADAFQCCRGDPDPASGAGADIAPEDRGRRNGQDHQHAGHPVG